MSKKKPLRPPVGIQKTKNTPQITSEETHIVKNFQQLMDKYELHRPHLSCQPGEIESFVYKLKNEFSPSETDPKFMLVN